MVIIMPLVVSFGVTTIVVVDKSLEEPEANSWPYNNIITPSYLLTVQ